MRRGFGPRRRDVPANRRPNEYREGPPKMLHRRAIAAAALGLAAGAAGRIRRAAAQQPAAPAAFPNRPVTVLVPWGAGGSTDAFARVLAARLGSDLGQPFV